MPTDETRPSTWSEVGANKSNDYGLFVDISIVFMGLNPFITEGAPPCGTNLCI